MALFSHLLFALLQLIGSRALACTGDFYSIPAGVAQTIDECGVCRIITNGGTQKILVPTRTSTEWTSFYTNVTANTGGAVTVSACGSVCTYPLDTISTPGAAYSIRRLRTAYTGPLLRVRRSSDNAEQDIGFSSSGCGDLDTAALTTFVGGNSAFIRTWYDQSGNGRNISQTTSANQPRLVNAGTLEVTSGGRAGVRWYDTTGARLLETTAPFASTAEMTVNMVLKETVRQNCWNWILATDVDPGGRISAHMAWSDGRLYWDVGGCCAAPNRLNISMPVTVGSTNVYSFVNSASANTRRVYVNSTSVLSGTPITSTIARIRLGSNGTEVMNGAYSEFLIFPTLLNSGDLRTIELNQKNYYSTP
jgi:hypothetical protein